MDSLFPIELIEILLTQIADPFCTSILYSVFVCNLYARSMNIQVEATLYPRFPADFLGQHADCSVEVHGGTLVSEVEALDC